MTENNEKLDLAVGGQALIEGVMMRTPHIITLAVRRPDGEVYLESKPFISLTKRYKVLGYPIIRGVIGFFEMLVLGTKALNKSAEISLEEEREATDQSAVRPDSNNENTSDPSADEKKYESSVHPVYFVLTIVFSLVFALFIFKFIPLWLSYQLEGVFPAISERYWLFNLIDGVIKISFLIIYIGAISLIPDIKRVFQYHGAEHKSIYTYESDANLEPTSAKEYSRFHPRCGTSFILVVFVLSILVYTLVPRHPLFVVTLFSRIALLPLIAGLSYEFLKWSGKHRDSAIARFFSQPGLWMQRLTTKEPDLKQLEIGLISLKEALRLEKQYVADTEAKSS